VTHIPALGGSCDQGSGRPQPRGSLCVPSAFPRQSPKNLEYRSRCKQIGVFAETTQIARLQLEEQPRASSCVQKARGDPHHSAGAPIEPQLVIPKATVGQRLDKRSCAFASE
jgi:hypothetical protein